MFISIVIPAYNEQKRISPTLAEVQKILNSSEHTYEIIVVDDGSLDNTAELIKSLAEKTPQLKLKQMSQNQGKGAAVRHGVSEAKGEIVLIIDADGSTPFTEYTKLIDAHDQNKQAIIIGSRHLSDSHIVVKQPWYRIIISRVANVIIQLMLLPGIKDTQCGFKLFPTSIAKEVFALTTIDGFGYDMEVLYIAKKKGYVIQEVPVTWLNSEGSTLRPIRSTIHTFKELTIILWRHRFGKNKDKDLN